MSDELEQGLRRAREHLGRATLEMVEAARALLDASLRATGLHSVAPDSLAGEIGRNLDALLSSLRAGGPFQLPSALADPLSEALEAEIERWEARSKTDVDARPVLRAFLGLRELLWELGLRPPAEPRSPHATKPRDPAQPASGEPAKSRVQRFDVEG